MAKITLDNINGGYDLSLINNNFDKIETELNEKVLYRNPPVNENNSLEVNLDANQKTIYNLASISTQSLSINGTPVVTDTLFVSPLPDPIGQTGKILQSDGVSAFWSTDTPLGLKTALADTAQGDALLGVKLNATGSSSRTQDAKNSETISVTDFGAVGNNVTDCTTAFASAYTYLLSLGGGELLIPPGTYKLSSSWVLTGTGLNQNSANITIKGSEGYSVVLDFTSALANTDGIQIAGASRIKLEGFAVKNAKRYGINVNSGQVPGDPTFVSRFAIKDVIIDNASSHGIRLANAYMGLLENIESRNNGGNGFHFEGNHTSITAIRCWAGGDGIDPDGGNAGTGWFINGILYSSFISCASDWNGSTGYAVSNCSGLTFNSCGAESNRGEGWLITSSLANSTGSPVTGVNSIEFTGCFGFNNSLAAVNGFANFIGVVTANSIPASVSFNGCNDLLTGGQTISAVFNGTSGQIKVFDNGNNLTGTRIYSGTVVNGDFLSNTVSSGSASSLTSGISANAGSPAVSITLPAGDWDVWGVADFNPAATTSITNLTAGISTTSATFGGQDTFIANRMAANVPNGTIQVNTPITRIRSTGTTVVYLVVVSAFTVSTLSAYGSIFAKRAK